MDTLALTDRDGMYGVVKFATACAKAGIRPVFGVDLAVASLAASEAGRADERRGASAGERSVSASRRTPARGGSFLDPGLPRVVLLARNGRGWAALCRLVSATHLAGERGTPV